MSIITEEPSRSGSPEQPSQAVTSSWQVLKNRNFLLLWMAQLISLTILNAANYGLIVLVQDTTNSVILVGLAIIAFQLPAFPFGAIAGVIVDWFDKRQVLWISNALRMGTMLLMCLSLLSNPTNIWPLFILIFLTALIGQFFTPAEGSSIPLLVGERELMPALALFNITLTVSMVIGFLLLGGLVTTLFPPFTLQLGSLVLHMKSIDMLFLMVALLYGVCTILILCIPARAFEQAHVNNNNNKPTNVTTREAIVHLWHDMVEGWNIVRADHLLFFSVIQLSVIGIIMLLVGELAGTFVTAILHRPAADMALILAPAGIGLVGASVLAPRITERFEKMKLTTTGLIALAAGFMLLIVSQKIAFWLDPAHGAESPFLLIFTMALVFFLGAALGLINVPTQTLMQERAPEEGRARVISLQFMMYNIGSIPVLLFAAVIAKVLDINWLVVVVSASLLLFCWWGRWYTGKQGLLHFK
ncbi:MFS transporter [Ktedonosporobacter rubrisoli]|uniref:MFS transporter n=1 Tax=Ktedonosporobacter rubrisoli TaxID=2509675 RepID=A0A4P6JVS8_KTERU|nr:MFS transporter [Ktedonosporobacter rubrisoli]QBD79779.1 MFS transporter [Ktedonosporobacter rubrisoli]